MGISNLFIKYNIQYVVIASTALYWIIGLVIRIFPFIFMPPSQLWSFYRVLLNVLRVTNIISIILLMLILYFRTWNLKYTIILLFINILTVFVGPYFIAL